MNKKIIITLLAVALLFSFSALAQKKLPVTDIKNFDGKTIKTSSVLSDSLPIILTFWSTICKPCITELDAFSYAYEEMQEELPFKLIAVSTDDQRTVAKVKAFVKGRRWPFTILLDENQDLKRMMNVSVQPHLFILDKDGNILYSHVGHVPMGEEVVFEKMLELFKK